MADLTRQHERRLRSIYRSAGWPCLDAIEIDLLNAGLVERMPRAGGAEALRVTDAGLAALAGHLQHNRRAFDAHESLVERTAQLLAGAGRLVFRQLALRAPVEETWRLCRPDVYSLRASNVAPYTLPVIHEIKVRRADLKAELARPAKRAAYQALSAEFYYVLPEGLATLEEIPSDCGVVYVGPGGLRPGRPSPRRAVEPDLQVWMALARRAADFVDPADLQAELTETTVPPSP